MINVQHSGHIGDIIYSLPAIKAIAEQHGERVTYYLQLNVPIPTDYDGDTGAKAAITAKLAAFITPLLEAQPYIERCVSFNKDTHVDAPLHLNLDMFRQLPVNFYLGHLPLHYMHLSGHFTDYGEPWLTLGEAARRPELADSIIIGRSPRSRSEHTNYQALNSCNAPLHFVGTAEEFSDMKLKLPRLTHLKVANALDMAAAIASSRLYVGNSSFNFALAEGLKHKRLFEMNLKVQSLMPCRNVSYFSTDEQLNSALAAEGLLEKHSSQ